MARTAQPQETHGPVQPPLPWPILLLVIGMFLALIAAHPDRVNHDSAQHLQIGQMILHGAVPFIDVYDTNPPLIMYLSAIPAGIAQALGVPIMGESAGDYTIFTRSPAAPVAASSQ
ncbi:MAG: hypothetical protein ACM3VW_09545 [Bacteroidota bacterium]